MSRRKPASSRGLSIVEVAIVAAIAGMSLSLIAGLCKPMLAAQNSEAASLTGIQVIDSALYRLQSDVRQSDPNGIFICGRSGQSVSCSLASYATQPIEAQILAILTAQAGGAGPCRWDNTGRPLWSGFNIYWLAPDPAGVSTMYYAFVPANVNLGQNPAVLNADAAAAAAHAIGANDPLTIARNVTTLQSMVDVTHDRVALRLMGANTVGTSTSELTVQGDAYARN